VSELVLHGYWRSGTSYRVRIALNLKTLAYQQVGVDLRTGAQSAPDFTLLNPQGLVPALQTPAGVLTQSPAILEWLEEAYPHPPLLPAAPSSRAEVRAMCALIACDIHPLQNLRVLKALRSDYAADEEAVQAWPRRWIASGFDALERLVERRGGAYAFGDALTLADVYLAPQVYSAGRFGVDLGRWPRLRAASDRAAGHPAFQQAHPDAQPDAEPTSRSGTGG
jgi:maleylpyruvate isomerase